MAMALRAAGAALCALALVACDGDAQPSATESASGATTTLSPDLGVDRDGNGVADRLDAYVARIPGGPDTRAAATAYYRLVSRLAVKAQAGEKLTEPERQNVFRALACYSESVESDGVDGRHQAGLDSEFTRDRNSFNAMYALRRALNGTAAHMSTDKAEMCRALPDESPAPPTLNPDLGADADGNGVADRLDAYVARIPGGPDTKAAATAYYRLVSRLATKVRAGEKLTEPEQQNVFRALACYSTTARAEGVTNRAGLDAEFMRDRGSLAAMTALQATLNGTAAELSLDKADMCTPLAAEGQSGP